VIQLTPDVRLLWAPSATYRGAIAERADTSIGTWGSLAVRLITPAAIAGIATAMTATGRITWSLALSGTLCWTLLAILQTITAAAVILPSRRDVGLPRAIELFFAGHAPWSLWLIGASAIIVFAPGLRVDAVLITASVPFVWTAFVTFGFARHVLGLGRRAAVIRTFVHQCLTSAVIALYVGWAVQIWPRLLSLLTP
jgi:hypothetical protein